MNGRFRRSSSAGPTTDYLRKPASPAGAGKRKIRPKHGFVGAGANVGKDGLLSVEAASRDGVLLSRSWSGDLGRVR